MPTLPLMRSKHLIPFAAYLNRHGTPLGRLLLQAGLPSDCLEDPEMLITTFATRRFRDQAAQISGLPNIALTVVQPLEFKDLGEFGQELLRIPTLSRLLSEFCTLVATQTSCVKIELQPQPGGDLAFSHFVNAKYGRED